MASANAMFKSHEEYRRNRELEEARKAGIAPAAVDEEGKEINPHIPQYMSSAPWYLNSSAPSLKHQKDWRAKPLDSRQAYDRGAKTFQATTFRKGACENCGAMSHKTADCTDRPRARGAKWTKMHIAADEKIHDPQLESFDARRDRWNGYDTAEYARVVDRFEKADELKRDLKKAQALEKAYKKGKDNGDGEKEDESSSEEDEDKIAEEKEAGFGKVEKRVRTTAGGASGSVRNLRIREDTAKYLLNLDLSSAHYDPKSRSMREDPQPNRPDTEKSFKGDNFVRKNGDFAAWEVLTLHAHDAHAAGQAIHMQAAPSQAEALMHEFKAKKAAAAHRSKAAVLEAYGSAAAAKPEDIAQLGQSEGYVEYNAQGRVIKGHAQPARTRYEENVYPGNHTSVWGSWWQDGQWGFACCHQTLKQSWCTGEAGLRADARAEHRLAENLEARAKQIEDSREAAGSAPAQAPGQDKKLWGSETDADTQLDADKLAQALDKARRAVEQQLEHDDRKRKFNSLEDGGSVTAEDMEAYRVTRQRGDDPLTAMRTAAVKAGGAQSSYDLV